MCDQVAGDEHFRTTVQKGLEIIQALRGWTSGLAVPHFVIDAPGGGGKILLLPEYVVKLTDREVVLRNYAGKLYRYKQPKKDRAKAPQLEPVLDPALTAIALQHEQLRGVRAEEQMRRVHRTDRPGDLLYRGGLLDEPSR